MASASKQMQQLQLSDEQLGVWRAFLRAHSTMLRRIGRDLEEAELPPLAWYDVLAALRDAPDQHLRQVELAELVLLSHSGLSRLLDRIESKGLVERRNCPSDRRSFHVAITPGGLELLELMWPVYARGIAEDFLSALGDSPGEIGETLGAIGAQCDAVRETEAGAAANTTAE